MVLALSTAAAHAATHLPLAPQPRSSGQVSRRFPLQSTTLCRSAEQRTPPSHEPPLPELLLLLTLRSGVPPVPLVLVPMPPVPPVTPGGLLEVAAHACRARTAGRAAMAANEKQRDERG